MKLMVFCGFRNYPGCLIELVLALKERSILRKTCIVNRRINRSVEQSEPTENE